MEAILKTVIKRYSQLFPDWDVSVITIDKEKNINEQIDRIVKILNNMKQSG